jgi:hypothetical protein
MNLFEEQVLRNAFANAAAENANQVEEKLNCLLNFLGA